jgi:hypothetical protein
MLTGMEQNEKQNHTDRRESETYWQMRAEPYWQVGIRIILSWQKRIKNIFKAEKQCRTDTRETEQACQGRCRIIRTEGKQPSVWGENRHILSGKAKPFECLGISTFSHGITENVQCLFRGFFSERNSFPTFINSLYFYKDSYSVKVVLRRP